jgi:hypothetical protein
LVNRRGVQPSIGILMLFQKKLSSFGGRHRVRTKVGLYLWGVQLRHRGLPAWPLRRELLGALD